MTFGSVFGRTFSPTFQPSSQAAAGGGWWDLNGTLTSCVVAYQPKGAASYAASLTDLSGNSNDATEGTAPSWASATGWTFDGSGDYLKTGVTPTRDQTWSIAISYSGESNWNSTGWECMVGSFSTSGGNSGFVLSGQNRAGVAAKISVWTGTGTVLGLDDLLPSSGVFALAGRQTYLDGTPNITAPVGSTTGNHLELYIGGLNLDGTLAQMMSGNILAVSIYNATLTAQNIADLTTAMAAL